LRLEGFTQLDSRIVQGGSVIVSAVEKKEQEGMKMERNNETNLLPRARGSLSASAFKL
jgi:hypothetical protein